MRTECSSKAARTAEYVAGSDATSARVTPHTCTANPGPTGMVSIDHVPSLNLPPNNTRWQESHRRRQEQTSAAHIPACGSLPKLHRCFRGVVRYRAAYQIAL